MRSKAEDPVDPWMQSSDNRLYIMSASPFRRPGAIRWFGRVGSSERNSSPRGVEHHLLGPLRGVKQSYINVLVKFWWNSPVDGNAKHGEQSFVFVLQDSFKATKRNFVMLAVLPFPGIDSEQLRLVRRVRVQESTHHDPD
eukprot:6213969-Pleurochrysis_carterae.AAC.3